MGVRPRRRWSDATPSSTRVACAPTIIRRLTYLELQRVCGRLKDRLYCPLEVVAVRLTTWMNILVYIVMNKGDEQVLEKVRG